MRPQVVVLAGTNGAGKSSVAGRALREAGVDVYDPDEATGRYVEAGLPPDEANGRAWADGVDRLSLAIREGKSFAFETTLGGDAISSLLSGAARHGHSVWIWYVGLSSPDLHIQRVRARVARGGHHVPAERIRARWVTSRENLIRLLPLLDQLEVWDNSRPGDPYAGRAPEPFRVLAMSGGNVTYVCPVAAVPVWAKPIVVAALRCQG